MEVEEEEEEDGGAAVEIPIEVEGEEGAVVEAVAGGAAGAQPAGSSGSAPSLPSPGEVARRRRAASTSLKNSGNRAWAAGARDDAASLFRRAAEADPTSLPALANLANALLVLGRHAEAAHHAGSGVALAGWEPGSDAAPLAGDGSDRTPTGLPLSGRPGEPVRGLVFKCLHRRGVALLRLGRPDDAMRCLRHAAALDPSAPATLAAQEEALLAVAGGQVDAPLPALPEGSAIVALPDSEFAGEGPAAPAPAAVAVPAQAKAKALVATTTAPAAVAPPAAAPAAPATPAAPAAPAAAAEPSSPPPRAAPAAASPGPASAPAARGSPAGHVLTPEKAAAAVALAGRAVASSGLPPPPRDSNDLERALAYLSSRVAAGSATWRDTGNYLCDVDSAALKRIVRRRDMELTLIEAALHGLEAAAAAGRAKESVRALRDLATAPAFGLAVDLLGEDDRARASSVVKAAAEARALPKARAKVAAAFGL